jgi:hypothetical protein
MPLTRLDPDDPGRWAAVRRSQCHDRLLAGLAEDGEAARPSVAALPRAQRADPEGPQLRPDRRPAPTTSLPETPGGARNWDYRYTWIRDSAFILRSLYRLGFGWKAIDYFGFLIDAIGSGDINRSPELQIMYGIGGEREFTERTMDHLSGWRGAALRRTEAGLLSATLPVGGCRSLGHPSQRMAPHPCCDVSLHRLPNACRRVGRARAYIVGCVVIHPCLDLTYACADLLACFPSWLAERTFLDV